MTGQGGSRGHCLQHGRGGGQGEVSGRGLPDGRGRLHLDVFSSRLAMQPPYACACRTAQHARA